MNIRKVLESKDVGILMLRFAVGGLMLFHGVAKMIHGHGAIIVMLSQRGLPSFLWLLVPLTEIVAPLFLILGLFTRISSLGIVLLMICTIFLAFGLGAFAIGEHGGLVAELNLLFLSSALALIFTGGGRYSIYPSRHVLLS